MTFSQPTARSITIFRSLTLATVAATAAAMLLAADAGSLSLGGVELGGSIQDVVRAFGTPDQVQTSDQGHTWQWAEAGGLDREIVTNDDLVITQILVAPGASSPTVSAPPIVQPREAPVLGQSIARATRSIEALGGERIPEPEGTIRAWQLKGGVLVAELNAHAVARLLALDERTAYALGYLQPATRAPDHRSPMMEKAFVPQTLPEGSGTVVVRAQIDATGKVTDVRVLVPSGNRSVDDWEILSVRKSTFRPAVCDGTPCPGVYLDIGGVSR